MPICGAGGIIPFQGLGTLGLEGLLVLSGVWGEGGKVEGS